MKGLNMILSDTSGLSKGSEKRVKVKCDSCGNESETTYSNYFHSQEKRAWPLTTYCRSCVCKLSANARRGKPAHNKGKKLPPSKKGENHPSWKGGRYVSSDGYLMVRKKTGGRGWQGYQKEHTILIENKIGRKLLENEVIHHIDGNKQNNNLTNLWLTTGDAHKNAHNSLQKVGFELFQAGILGFDKSSGTYFLRDKNALRCNGQSS